MAAANYSVNLTVSGNIYTVAAVQRAPGVVASGGTELKVTYADAASTTTNLNVGDAMQRALDIMLADKAANG